MKIEEVDRILDKALSPFPDEIQTDLRKKFHQFYNNPLISELQSLVSHNECVVTAEFVQRLQFAPTTVTNGPALYALILSSESHSKLKRTFIPLFSLYHIADFKHFCFDFIKAGGLSSLANSCLFHEDLHIRGQAIDSFIQLTCSAEYDWFKESALNNEMYRLVKTTTFVVNLLRNSSTEHKNLPGIRYSALQILAFFLGWVRQVYYCDPNTNVTKASVTPLRLSRSMLDTLKSWGKTEDDSIEEERTLAAKLYEDFIRFGPAENEDELFFTLPQNVSDTVTSLSRKTNSTSTTQVGMSKKQLAIYEKLLRRKNL